MRLVKGLFVDIAMGTTQPSPAQEYGSFQSFFIFTIIAGAKVNFTKDTGAQENDLWGIE